MTLKQIEKKLAAVERRLQKLEQGRQPSGVARKPRAHKGNGNGAKRAVIASSKAKTANQRAHEILESAGLLADLPPEAKKRAAAWRARPAQERKRILEEFSAIPLDKPLSEILLENRR